jgi:hypothetical protein
MKRPAYDELRASPAPRLQNLPRTVHVGPRRPCGCGTRDLARIITSEPEPEFAADLRERYALPAEGED